MKIYKFLFLFVAVALFSCGDDEPIPDGQQGQNNPSIIGTWTLTDLNSMNGVYSQTGGQIDLNGTFVMTGQLLNATVEIEEDNTYSSTGTLQVETTVTIGQIEIDGPTSTTFLGNGTWTKNGNSLVLVGNGETTNCTVVTLTDTDFDMDYPFETVEDENGIVTTLSGVLRYGFTRQ